MRSIEYARRAVPATEPATFSYARNIGRVGLLAAALGIGSAVAMPMAFADTTGSSGSTGSADAATPSTKPAPSRRAPHSAPHADVPASQRL